MCGRYALYGPRSRIRDRFDLDDGFDFGPRYNIAPTTNVLVVRPDPNGRRVGSLYRWGLIPGWAKDGTMPVILAPGDYDAWLDPANVNVEMLRAFLCPAEADDMIAYPVSRAVNSSRTDAPMLVEPA